MEIATIILLFMNMALLASILVFMFCCVDLLRQQTQPVVVEKQVEKQAVRDEPDKIKSELEDESVPLEQFTPDFTKPITFKADIDKSIEVEE